MRILLLVHTFPSRSQSFVLNQILGLKRLGANLRILAKKADPHAAGCLPALQESGLLGRTTYLQRKRRRAIGRGLTGAARLLCFGVRRPRALAKAVGVAISTTDFSALQVLHAFEGLKQEKPFDLVYAQFGSNANMAIMLRRMGLCDVPIAIAFRGADLTALPARKPRIYDLAREEALRPCFLPTSRPRVFRSSVPPW
jgi:colanic acid/amylovoran biosynthesis glycosyltransferase